jgi:hypothetical protein
MIGIIGLTTDMLLAWFGKILFPWKRRGRVVKLGALPASASEEVVVTGALQQNRPSPLLSNLDKLEAPVARETGAAPLQS